MSDETTRARISDAASARAFILGGDARVTLVSRATGVRFTYRVAKGDGTAPHFVSLLRGADNASDYTFMGSIFEERDFRHGRRSRISDSAPSARAFAWAWSHLSRDVMPDALEVWHEGRCCRCGRALTDPESIATGIGPVCRDARKAAA